ncbi:MAG TPA: thioredoxin [Myxococcota bacterium]
MATVHATEQNFENLVTDSDILVVDFWAEWCGPCKAFAPVFEQMSNKHGDVTFAKVDTEEQQGLARAFGVRAIPMVAVFRQQVLLYAEAGALPESALEELITQARGLDMVKVKAEIAEEEAKAKAAGGGGHVHGPGCNH